MGPRAWKLVLEDLEITERELSGMIGGQGPLESMKEGLRAEAIAISKIQGDHDEAAAMAVNVARTYIQQAKNVRGVDGAGQSASSSGASAPTAATPTDAVEDGADEAAVFWRNLSDRANSPAVERFLRQEGLPPCEEELRSSEEEGPNGDSAQLQYGAEAAPVNDISYHEAISDATHRLQEGQADREENARAAKLVM